MTNIKNYITILKINAPFIIRNDHNMTSQSYFLNSFSFILSFFFQLEINYEKRNYYSGFYCMATKRKGKRLRLNFTGKLSINSV